MALEKTMEHKGIVINDAYCKLINMQGDKQSLYYAVGVFANNHLAGSINNVIFTINGNFTPAHDDDSIRWDKQIYEYLKTTDDFVDAIDV